MYGWGTYRNTQGVYGFSPTQRIAASPTLVYVSPGVTPAAAQHDQIVQIAAGESLIVVRCYCLAGSMDGLQPESEGCPYPVAQTAQHGTCQPVCWTYSKVLRNPALAYHRLCETGPQCSNKHMPGLSLQDLLGRAPETPAVIHTTASHNLSLPPAGLLLL